MSWVGVLYIRYPRKSYRVGKVRFYSSPLGFIKLNGHKYSRKKEIPTNFQDHNLQVL